MRAFDKGQADSVGGQMNRGAPMTPQNREGDRISSRLVRAEAVLGSAMEARAVNRCSWQPIEAMA